MPSQTAEVRADHNRGGLLAAAGGARGEADRADALHEEEPLIRGHATWALGRIGTEVAMEALRGREAVEEDAWVREEIERRDGAGRQSR